MDIGTLVGIVLGFGLVFGSILIGPSPAGFLDTASMMIVLGGVAAATLISFPLEEVIQAFKASAKTFTIGLVQMLTQLDDPKTLGPAMAVAIITTFYGSLLANMIFNPLSAKLQARSAQEAMNLMIIFEGAKSILENNNPRFVYEKLSSFLPPKDRKAND